MQEETEEPLTVLAAEPTSLKVKPDPFALNVEKLDFKKDKCPTTTEQENVIS